MFYGVRLSEIRSLIRHLFRGCQGGEFQTLEMTSTFFELTLNVVMRMISGKRYYGENTAEVEARHFKEIVTKTFRLSGATNVGDFVPVLKIFGLSGLHKKLVLLQGKRDKFMQNLIEQHRKTMVYSTSDDNNKTMIDVLLSLQETKPEYYTDEYIRGMMLVSLCFPLLILSSAVSSVSSYPCSFFFR